MKQRSIFVIAGLVGLVAVCNGEVKNLTPREKSEMFTFIVLGDNRPHGDAVDKFTQPPQFYRNIKEINLLDPDFAVIVGDLILGYTDDRKRLKKMWDKFDEAVAKFTVPYYQVIGNHDVANQVMQDVYLKRYGKQFPLYYSFNHKGCHFIVLDTDLHGEYNEIINRQLAWLKTDLEANKGARKLFVFMHKPLFKYGLKSNWTDQVHPLMAKYGVDTVFCGHWHNYTRYKTLDGVRYIITGGAGAELGNRPEIMGGFYHYCPVTVRGDKVSISVIRTGCVMNENVVNEATAGKVQDLAMNLTTLRLAKETQSLPKQMDLIVSNPFARPITGTLFFDIPDGSPWKISNRRIAIAIKADARQKIPLPLPLGGTPDNLGPLKPFPKISWRLNIGDLGYTLPGHRPLRLRIDHWPYAQNLEKLRRKGVTMQPIAKISKQMKISKQIEITCLNPLDHDRIRTSLSWRLPDGCRWKISPMSQVKLNQAPGQTVKRTFSASFTGTPDDLFPLPRLDVRFVMEGMAVLKVSKRLPIKARDFFAGEFPRVRCVRVSRSPIIDGRLNDAQWKSCPVASGFLLPHADGRADYPTEARFTYDENNLYMGFRCVEPDLAGLITQASKRDGPTWKDDSLEIFLDTNLDRKTYYQYAINASGVVYDGRGTNGTWNGPCVVKAGRTTGAWTLEVAIAWKTLGVKAPIAGKRMGLELVRNRAQSPCERSMWSPTFGGNHVPKRFGILNFCNHSAGCN